MARQALKDILRNDSFYLLDFSLGELTFATQLVQAGFKSCSVPELTVETQDVKEGNWPFARRVITGGSVNPITATKGVTWYDSDFWRWISRSLVGEGGGLLSQIPGLPMGIRKDFVLVHFMKGTGLPMTLQLPGFDGGLFTKGGLGEVSLVPAKAWIFRNAVPLRYKAGTDFDGEGGAISLAEIEFGYDYFDEISVGNAL